MRKAIWILWPAFIVGGAAETLFFTLFDPMELHLFGEPAGMSRLAVYSGGFFYSGRLPPLRARSRASCSAPRRRSTAAR